jgi:anti-sigma B factor antagonist
VSLEEFHSLYFQVGEVDGATVARFIVPRLSEELNIEQLGYDLFSLVDQHDLSGLVLSMNGVEYMNSSVLGKLITLHRRLHRKSGRLVLCEPSETVRDILKTSRLLDYFRVTDSVPAAVAVLN